MPRLHGSDGFTVVYDGFTIECDVDNDTLAIHLNGNVLLFSSDELVKFSEMLDSQTAPSRAGDAYKEFEHSKQQRYIVWRDGAKTVGVIVEEYQMAYELRKGALNSLGIVTGDFVEAWAEMTADDECVIEEVTL